MLAQLKPVFDRQSGRGTLTGGSECGSVGNTERARFAEVLTASGPGGRPASWVPLRANQGRSLAPVAIMPASGTRTGVTNIMAALWILVSSLVLLPSFYGAIAYDRQSGAYGFSYDPSFYGAIAYDRQSGAYGFAYDQPSPVAAGRRALDKCGSPGCALVLEFADGCGAYATGPNAAAGAGSD